MKREINADSDLIRLLKRIELTIMLLIFIPLILFPLNRWAFLTIYFSILSRCLRKVSFGSRVAPKKVGLGSSASQTKVEGVGTVVVRTVTC